MKEIILSGVMARCENCGNGPGSNLFQTPESDLHIAANDEHLNMGEAGGPIVEKLLRHQHQTGHSSFDIYPNKFNIDPEKPLAFVTLIGRTPVAILSLSKNSEGVTST